MNIYEKIAAIMKSVQYMEKDDRVEYGSNKYKALSEEKATATMRKQMIEHGLIVYPVSQQATRAGSITHVDVVYRMVNVDNPEEYIEIASCGDGADTQDKGSGKAMTYAFKYMWLRTFAIPTGEDPDKISSEELDDIQRRKQKEEERTILCECCGSPILATQRYSVSELLKKGKEQFSAKYCFSCLRKMGDAGKKKADAINAVENYGN